MRDAGIDLSDLDVHEDRPRARAFEPDGGESPRRSQLSANRIESQRSETPPARRVPAGAVDLLV
jgi:hypothetical protein